MSELIEVHEPGDRLHTLTPNGVLLSWVVDPAGLVVPDPDGASR